MKDSISLLCRVRDVCKAVATYEQTFNNSYGICLNEGMLLCSLLNCNKMSAGEIAQKLGITNSNTSKIIKSAEAKGYIERGLGEQDKRQMYFSITETGKEKIETIKNSHLKLPEVLKKLTEEI